MAPLDQVCQTEIHNGTKFKTFAKPRATYMMYIYSKMFLHVRSVWVVWRHRHKRALSWLTRLNIRKALEDLKF